MPAPRDRPSLLIFGLGYSATAVACAALAAGWQVAATQRRPAPAPAGVTIVGFADAAPKIGQATHVLSSVPPQDGDPVLVRYGADLRQAPALRWIGYLSTTGVYGNRDGGWVDEGTPAAPDSERGRRRVAAEEAWSALGRERGIQVDLFRLAGIYGPGRSVLDDLRAGTARRVVKPGQAFGRIHRDDIARAVLAAMAQTAATSPRVLNLSDDMPAASAEVIAEGARLLGLAPPPAIPFEVAAASMSPMALSFWADNRRVASAATQAALGLRWRYPTYRDGLRAILAAEQEGDGLHQQRQIPGA